MQNISLIKVNKITKTAFFLHLSSLRSTYLPLRDNDFTEPPAHQLCNLSTITSPMVMHCWFLQTWWQGDFRLFDESCLLRRGLSWLTTFYPSLNSTFWVFLTTELNRLARVGRNLTNTVINIHILPLTPVQRVETRHQLVFRELTLSLIHNFLFSSDDSPEELCYVAVVGRQALSFQAMETSSDHMDQRRR